MAQVVGPTLDAVQAYHSAFARQVVEAHGPDVQEGFSICPEQTESIYYARATGSSLAQE